MPRVGRLDMLPGDPLNAAWPGRARSSAGEHTLHTGGVTGSIPVAPTTTSVHRTSPPGRMFRWEASVPEGLRIRERHEDAYAWALAQAARLRRGGAGLKGL